MKISCSQCEQRLEIDEAAAGQTFACPTCGQPFVVPSMAPASVAAPRPAATTAPARLAPPPARQPRPPSPAPATASPERSGPGLTGGLLLLGVLLMGGYGYMMYRFQESPQQVWRRLLGTAQTRVGQATVTPEPTAAATPQTADARPPTLAATPVPVAAAAPPDPLGWIAEHQVYQPQTVNLTVATTFPNLGDEQSVGSGLVQVGSILRLLSINPEARTVMVAYDGYNDSVQNIPITSTDLITRLRAAMASAGADAKPAGAHPAATPSAETAVLAGDPQGLLKQEARQTGPFVHPGLLHNEEDFRRMRAHLDQEPWKSGYARLIANPHASLGYRPRPVETIYRGRDKAHTDPENYALLFNDTAAAYACALRWRISGDGRYAEKSIAIMNAWSSTLKALKGSTDSELAAGIYGYEFANAGEIMRTYKGWQPEDFARFKTMLREVFLPGNTYFLRHHNNAPLNHYWANWDLCNMASLLAIGVLCDDRALYDEAVNYFKFGKGMGSIKNAVPFLYPGGLGQWQEAGRDQGHTTLGVSLMGAFCEMACKQGDDLYGYDNNRFLAACEYIAKYNLGEDVPYTPYKNDKWLQSTISANARGLPRPTWELVYNHYAVRKGLPAPYTARMAAAVRPEGGGGDYGPNSGGYDQLGYGTLTATLGPRR